MRVCMKAFLTRLEDLEVFGRNEAIRKQMFQRRGFVLQIISICHIAQLCYRKKYLRIRRS